MTSLWLETLSWQPSQRQEQQFQQLYQEILTGNRRLNLTRIVEPADFWEKHLWDSLRGIVPWLHSTSPIQRAIDLGTGAGFPGIPIAIAGEAIAMTLVDSIRKKVMFVESLVRSLELQQVEVCWSRAETLCQQPQHRGTYDLVTLRAVASAVACAQYALPYLKPGGMAVLYRGQWTEAEMKELARAIAPLDGSIETVEAYTTPLTQGIRHCIYLRKDISGK